MIPVALAAVLVGVVALLFGCLVLDVYLALRHERACRAEAEARAEELELQLHAQRLIDDHLLTCLCESGQKRERQ